MDRKIIICIGFAFICIFALLLYVRFLRNQPPIDSGNHVEVTYEEFQKKELEEKVAQSDKEIKNELREEKVVPEEKNEEPLEEDGLTTAYNELQGTHTGVVINLAVPYSSQAPEKDWDQPWQDACEEVSLLMLDSYYRGYTLTKELAKDEIIKMVSDQTARGWGGSISIDKIKIFYDEYFSGNKTARIIEDPTVEQIKNLVSTGNPVFVIADGKTLPNKWYSNGGPDYHALIIRGFTEDTFITNDPGVNRGTNFEFPISSVMNSIHDWNDGDVKQGRSAVLILE